MKCCMPLCENKSENCSKCDKITFHGFPIEESLRAAWLRALGIQDTPLSDCAVICSMHFLHDDICETESGSRQLRPGAVPSTVLVCMICLDTDSKMSPISQYNLRAAYEKLTGHPLWDGGNLKQTLCVQCAQRLKNFSRFREQSLRARFLMMELLEKHELITIQHIKMIQHANYKLSNNLVLTTLGPDPCDLIEENCDEGRLDSKETVLGVAVKTECIKDSQSKDEDMREIKVENSDCVKEELSVKLLCNIDKHPAAPSTHSAVIPLSARRATNTVDNKPAASVPSETEPGTSGDSSHTRKFTCYVCGCAFTQKGPFLKHMRTHTGEKPYSCEICGHKFRQKGHFIVHMRTHTGEKPFLCEICSYKYKHESTLVKHIMRTHTSEKPYSCEICKRKYTLKCDLTKHMRTHTGKKPYSCEICSFKCTQKGVLVHHIMTHTGEKPYSCEICSYKCNQKCNLVTHMRTHTGEKPYSCEICYYKFADKSSLARHLRIHTGEKPYSCKICEHKFRHSSVLVKHMTTHTGAH